MTITMTAWLSDVLPKKKKKLGAQLDVDGYWMEAAMSWADWNHTILAAGA